MLLMIDYKKGKYYAFYNVSIFYKTICFAH
jgi:hypothetical protein